MTELFHGTWWDLRKKDSLDKVMNGRFTKLFPDLAPARFDENDLRRLAQKMTSKQERRPTPETEHDPEEDPEIHAAYTYLGQFVDHSIRVRISYPAGRTAGRSSAIRATTRTASWPSFTPSFCGSITRSPDVWVKTPTSRGSASRCAGAISGC